MANSRDGDFPGLPEELICQILIWVAVKSLMRFTSVCKLWLSIILNPLFARAFQGGSKGLLLVHRTGSIPHFGSSDFFLINFPEGDAPTNISFLYTMDFGPLVMSSLVNCFVCLYKGDWESYLFNIATRKMICLPDSRLHGCSRCIYHLGFDPSSQIYKVLKTCYSSRKGRMRTEILTMKARSSWRRIDSPPGEKCIFSGLCRNGVLYWTHTDGSPEPSRLLCFDVAQEKFRFISHPKKSYFHLLLFGPNLGLASSSRLRDSSQETLMFYNDDNQQIGSGSSGQSSGSWRQHVFRLPKSTGEREFSPAGVLPNGKAIYVDENSWNWEFPVPFYLSDLNKGELEKRFISDCSPRITEFERVERWASRGGFKGLLLSNLRYPLTPSHPSIDFFYLNYLEDEVTTNIIHHYSIPTEGKMKSTQLMNGLICLYFGKYSWVYNITTREKMSLPVSVNEDYRAVYHLGFDPSNKVYKLLKTNDDLQVDQSGYLVRKTVRSEILTLGVDSSWRSIDPAPWVILIAGSCIEGVLYWNDTKINHIGNQLICFDLAREEFRVTPHPQILGLSLFLFGPNLALATHDYLPDSIQTTMLFYNDDNNRHIGNGESGNISSSRRAWQEHVVNLPKEEDSEETYALYDPNGVLQKAKWPSIKGLMLSC
ncbi:OLC1v1004751C1 [Oldenlandia corymbosa var. corymbosa]|uniref:OLC1v1004751C1 n=1 Tax=Oldenlandia corymbosa var. corymbosa TaxID=529605 RepID=A0AAV1DFH2_OLDCO|nr:OLC1v1004751C1 [Oldenlandia corymbosa var. corymbosa]